ncbi:glycosyltransferase family 39 protein [Curtobacterium sp. 260]|uniref:glycosyltransferase family 39 protein n=1 Tax=Curtobacterium sp. 260 TaxID=2817748 RepID=UPI0027870104|nr:glycosyltransferase family 39 protein [Curtobacterium sp. 260]MDP9737842.1 mannosyltransferase [Curtobacterium sp. 260]
MRRSLTTRDAGSDDVSDVPASDTTRPAWRHPAVPASLVGIAAFLVSFAGTWAAPAGIDEAATMSSARRSLPELWHMAHNVDGVHSTYYALMHLWLSVVPYDMLTLRLPSVIASAVAAALLVELGRRVADAPTGVVAGLVFAVLPRVTSASGQGRSYAFSFTFAVLLTLVLVVAVQRTRDRVPRAWVWWLGYALVAAVGSYFFLYSALLVVAHGVTVLVWQLTRRRPAGILRAGLWWLGAAAVAGLLVLPLVRMTSGQADKQLYWIGTTFDFNRKVVQSILVEQYFGDSERLALVGIVLAVVGVLVTVAVPRLRRRVRAVELAVPAVVVPLVAVLAVSILVKPLYNARYLTFTTPFVALAIALALTAFGALLRWRLTLALATAGVVVIALLAYPVIAAQRAPIGKTGTHWKMATDHLAAERAQEPAGSRDGIYYGPLPRHEIRTTEYVSSAYPDAFAGMRDLTLVRPASEVGELWAEREPRDREPDVSGLDRVWYLGAETSSQPATLTAQLEADGWRVESRKSVQTLEIISYVR